MQRVQVIDTGLVFREEPGRRASTKFIVIHHTGGDAGDDCSAAEIHAMHLRNGWAGIGYHEVFRKDGTVEAGRLFDAKGAHSIPGNNNSVGLHVGGNFNVEDPTPAQIESLVGRSADICEAYDLHPMTAIVGHRDQAATECPGERLYAMLPEIRERVRAAMQEGFDG